MNISYTEQESKDVQHALLLTRNLIMEKMFKVTDQLEKFNGSAKEALAMKAKADKMYDEAEKYQNLLKKFW